MAFDKEKPITLGEQLRRAVPGVPFMVYAESRERAMKMRQNVTSEATKIPGITAKAEVVVVVLPLGKGTYRDTEELAHALYVVTEKEAK